MNNRKISDEEILKALALLEAEEVEEELARLEKIAAELPEEECPVDDKFLTWAREYDKQAAQKKRKNRIKHSSRIAAVFLVSLITLGSITMGTSEAFKLKVFDLFFDEEAGGVSLVPEKPTEEELLKEWDGYGYPEYLPEGCELVLADEYELGRYMIFESKENGYELKLLEFEADGLWMGHDTEHQTMEEVYIGSSKGYLFVSEEYNECYAVWQAGDKVLQLEAKRFLDTEELLKIARSVKYVK